MKVAASLSHFSDTMQGILEKLAPVEIVRLGGAGNKCCSVANMRTDAYLHPSPGLCNWDLVANESLIKAMGGYATNFVGERLEYDVNKSHKIRGLIAAKTVHMFSQIKARMGEKLGEI
jgi:3'-phosphoadenosine 5'-phosphosulfate (PAPS) 3'-phosphatase